MSLLLLSHIDCVWIQMCEYIRSICSEMSRVLSPFRHMSLTHSFLLFLSFLVYLSGFVVVVAVLVMRLFINFFCFFFFSLVMQSQIQSWRLYCLIIFYSKYKCDAAATAQSTWSIHFVSIPLHTTFPYLTGPTTMPHYWYLLKDNFLFHFLIHFLYFFCICYESGSIWTIKHWFSIEFDVHCSCNCAAKQKRARERKNE